MATLATVTLAACFKDSGPGVDVTSGDPETTRDATASPSAASSATSESTSDATTDATTSDPTTRDATATTATPTSDTSLIPDFGGAVCAPPLADCDEPPDGRCETDLSSSNEHCGDCGAPCAGSCDDGECVPFKYVFVSQVSFGAALEGPEGGDQVCTAYAKLARLPGTYRAWLSDDTSSPATRFTKSTVPYIRLDDVIVADSWEDLTDGVLAASISVDEDGEPVDGGCDVVGVWSATTAAGEFSGIDNCKGWTDGADDKSTTNLGSATKTNGEWTQDGCPQTSCGETRRLYCFQQ